MALQVWAPFFPSGDAFSLSDEVESRFSGYARSAKASLAWSWMSYSPSTSAVNEGTLPSWYAYSQWRDMVTTPSGFFTAAFEADGRALTVHTYSMAAPLRLAK